ncbi:hypothetical protein [Streptomyces sp. NPDC058084]|uniref:hypothetical protein n=1 Tax=Streptomyces sp. NPDC058084 TaxID=3346333 RepID=UPI0036E173AC
MARMFAKTTPRHAFSPGALTYGRHRSKVRHLERRRARASEKRSWRQTTRA